MNDISFSTNQVRKVDRNTNLFTIFKAKEYWKVENYGRVMIDKIIRAYESIFHDEHFEGFVLRLDCEDLIVQHEPDLCTL